MKKLETALTAVLAIAFVAIPFIIYGMLWRLGYSIMDGALGLLKGIVSSPTVFAIFLVLGAIIWVQIAFTHAQYKLLKLCSEQSRTIKPGKIWLTLIPFIGQIVGMFVVNAISESVKSEFTTRNITAPPLVAGFAGYIFFATSLLSFIPALTNYGFLLLGFYVISLIIYWRSVGRCRRALTEPALSVQLA